jgi:shikimate kinase
MTALARLDTLSMRPIVLIGLMGVGKTTVGRRLAARLGWAFVDADQEIERAAGLSVAEIFVTASGA